MRRLKRDPKCISTLSAIHSDHRARCYAYAPGDKHFYPALDIYTSEKDGKLIQINISYNEHDYRESTWELHEEMCFAALGALLPDLSKVNLEELCQKVYKEAADHMFPHDQKYGRGAVPAVLFHHNGIGVYPYFTEGSRDYFCVIPVDEACLSEFEENGTRIE
ncbi:MAG: hypothetical protein Q4D71_12610, partial [Oscillospiraceae bacterium]|nr:hypothetical protein [Oscillospiraceae bacterium]